MSEGLSHEDQQIVIQELKSRFIELEAELALLKSETAHSMVMCKCTKAYKLPSETVCKVCRIAKLEAYIELHAGDWCSLSNESDMFRERCEEAEASNLALLATMADMKEELLTHQWVSVEDRLPVEETEVLVTSLTDDETIYQMDLCGGTWRNELGHDVSGNPTHWKELPTLPPEKEGE